MFNYLNLGFSWFRQHFELLFWISALLLLGLFTNPYESEGHFSLCLFKFMGFERCSGCGIGHSISFFLQGNPQASWQAHFMGIPAIAIIGYRIFVLLRMLFRSKQTAS